MVNVFKTIGSKITGLIQQATNYRYLVFSSGVVSADVDLIALESLNDFIRDTVGSCIDVRRQLRSVCSFEALGADGQRFLRALRGGSGFTTLESFVGQLSENYDVFGNAFYRLQQHASTNFLDRVETQDVVFHLVKRRIDRIGIRSGDGKTAWHDPKEFFHFKRSDPFSPIGRSILGELSEYLKMKRYLSGSWARHFATDGAPAGILQFKSKKLTQAQKDEIRNDWNKQYQWDRVKSAVGVLEGEGEYVPFPQRQLNYGSDHATIRDEIRAGLRVPKVLLGDTDGVNFSNAFTSLLAHKLTEVDAWHNLLSKELTYFANQHGYNCEVVIKSALDLEDFRAIAGVTGQLKPNSSEAL